MEAYGVNPLIVGEIEGANRAQAVVAESSFCDNVVNPLLTMLGEVYTSRVAPVFASENEKLVCWFDPAKASDDEQFLKRWEAGARHGVVKANEFRVNVLNLPEDPAFDGLLVGGRDMNSIERAMTQSIHEEVASLIADGVLDLTRGGPAPADDDSLRIPAGRLAAMESGNGRAD